MAKAKKIYVCRSCGCSSSKWMGQCPECKEWNTYVEETIEKERRSGSFRSPRSYTAKPVLVTEIENRVEERLVLPLNEVNRVLGGGMVRGSLVLLGGEPGIGKSTLSLQLAMSLDNARILYISGEESPRQIKMRADRLEGSNPQCYILPETLLENILVNIDEMTPDIVIVDSIQTIFSETVESAPGSVSQVRECAATLLRYAKETGTTVILIGHITKDGAIAGPKILEHIVDVVLQFEGDGNNIYRILRGIKNRFGATSEIGVFEMVSSGLKEVPNPSEILLSGHMDSLSGIAIGAAADGMRPYLIETQALVSNAAYGTPQRSSTGFDLKRLNMLIAVLEKRAGLKMFSKDVFLNFAGGFKVSDTGLDIAVIAAIMSSYFDVPISEGTCFAGEIGLSGEVRPAPRTEQRINEAERLGFSKIIISGHYKDTSRLRKNASIEIITISRVDELAAAIFKK